MARGSRPGRDVDLLFSLLSQANWRLIYHLVFGRWYQWIQNCSLLRNLFAPWSLFTGSILEYFKENERFTIFRGHVFGRPTEECFLVFSFWNSLSARELKNVDAWWITDLRCLRWSGCHLRNDEVVRTSLNVLHVSPLYLSTIFCLKSEETG